MHRITVLIHDLLVCWIIFIDLGIMTLECYSGQFLSDQYYSSLCQFCVIHLSGQEVIGLINSRCVKVVVFLCVSLR